jgi:hypothetical protein
MDQTSLQSLIGEPVDPSNEIYDMDCNQIISVFDFLVYLGNLDGFPSKLMGVDDPLLSGLACADPISTAGDCPSP